jgi:dephospho-CoA kinase/ribosomal protein S18 acetylase RimI-like enzyme
VKRILLTGMSGAGKSTIVGELAARGYKAIDADDGWTEPLPDGTRRWREDAVQELLDAEDAEVLFLAGCEENQVRFLPRFDEVILLSSPRDMLIHRLETRKENPFGKSPEERERILHDLETVEPRLRAIADHEIRTTGTIHDTVESILTLVAGNEGRPRIRQARADDAESIGRLFIDSFATLTYLPSLHTDEETMDFFANIVMRDQDVLVAETDGRISGFIAMHEDMVHHLYIRPDLRRHGIGSALLERAKEWMPSGFRLWVFQENLPARRFYEKHGLRVIEETDGSRNEERTPDALYEWRPSDT